MRLPKQLKQLLKIHRIRGTKETSAIRQVSSGASLSI